MMPITKCYNTWSPFTTNNTTIPYHVIPFPVIALLLYYYFVTATIKIAMMLIITKLIIERIRKTTITMIKFTIIIIIQQQLSWSFANANNIEACTANNNYCNNSYKRSSLYSTQENKLYDGRKYNYSYD